MQTLTNAELPEAPLSDIAGPLVRHRLWVYVALLVLAEALVIADHRASHPEKSNRARNDAATAAPTAGPRATPPDGADGPRGSVKH